MRGRVGAWRGRISFSSSPQRTTPVHSLPWSLACCWPGAEGGREEVEVEVEGEVEIEMVIGMYAAEGVEVGGEGEGVAALV